MTKQFQSKRPDYCRYRVANSTSISCELSSLLPSLITLSMQNLSTPLFTTIFLIFSTTNHAISPHSHHLHLWFKRVMVGIVPHSRPSSLVTNSSLSPYSSSSSHIPSCQPPPFNQNQSSTIRCGLLLSWPNRNNEPPYSSLFVLFITHMIRYMQ